jgi:hypothetical protein
MMTLDFQIKVIINLKIKFFIFKELNFPRIKNLIFIKKYFF